MKPKARKILTISMIAVTVLWAIAILLFYIAALDEVWGLLAFVKAADTRQNASFAVRLNKKGT